MKVLIDTNIFIPLETVSVSEIESETHIINDFYRNSKKLDDHIFLLEIQKKDILSDKNEERKKARLLAFEKYELIANIKETDTIKRVFPNVKENTHDYVDVCLLNALCANVVSILVTNDEGIHKKARKIKKEENVYYLSEAIDFLNERLPKDLDVKSSIPIIEKEKCFNIELKDKIFDSLRNDYKGFDNWFKTKCQEGHRDCLVVKEQNIMEGLCIYKTEDKEEATNYGMEGFVLKICTFKMTVKGNKLGELLLQHLFKYCYDSKVDWIYVTSYEKNYICHFFENFGFERYTKTKDDTGELVFRKRMFPCGEDLFLSPLEYNIKYGPRFFKTTSQAFLVPVIPSYYEDLFPEFEKSPTLFRYQNSYSNAIRKAYICKSNTKLVEIGDILFFYRSHDDKAIQTCGIVENLRRSSSVEEIVSIVGKRTVFQVKELEERCKKGENLIILFRQTDSLARPVSLTELVAKKLVKGVPQTISRLNEDAKNYLLEFRTR